MIRRLFPIIIGLPTANSIGLDVGLKEYYTDSNGTTVENPLIPEKR
jgi:putative transposase